MDYEHMKELISLLTRIADALEDQAKNQAAFNEMSNQANIENSKSNDEWRALQLQWREENVQNEIARQQATDKLNVEIIKQNELNRIEDLARQDKWHQDQMKQADRAAAKYLSELFERQANEH